MQFQWDGEDVPIPKVNTKVICCSQTVHSSTGFQYSNAGNCITGKSTASEF